MDHKSHRLEVLSQLSGFILQVERPHPVRVAIDGIDNAGKTYMSQELAYILAASGRQIIQASLDAFHLPKSVRYRLGPDSPEGYYLHSFNYEDLRACLLIPLGPTGNLRYQLEIYDYRKDHPVQHESRRAETNAILLFDGVFLLRPEIINDWDFSIFLKVSFEEALRRAIERDRSEISSKEATIARYEKRYFPGQRIYLERDKPEFCADVVIDNTELDYPILYPLCP